MSPTIFSACHDIIDFHSKSLWSSCLHPTALHFSTNNLGLYFLFVRRRRKRSGQKEGVT